MLKRTRKDIDKSGGYSTYGNSKKEVSKGISTSGYQAYARTPSQAPTISERVQKNKEYVFFDTDNLFPQRLIDIADNSAAHNTALTTIARHIAGDRLLFEGDGVEGAERFLESITGGLMQFVNRTANDISYFNGYAWQPIYNRLGQFAHIKHSDFSTVRSGKIDPETNDVNGFYLSADWKIATKRRSFSGEFELYKPHFIFPFNFETGTAEGRQLIYRFGYKPSKIFYPEPDYLGALHWLEIDHSVAEFHDNNLKNGFAASAHIHVPTVKEDDEALALRRGIERDYAGSASAGGIFVTMGGVDEEAPVINTVPQLNNTELLSQLHDKVNQEIVIAHNIPPMLIGMQVSTGLQSEGLALKEALDLFHSGKIRPKQMWIENDLNKILELHGFSATVKIKRLDPIDFIPSDEILLETWTGNEIRELHGKEDLQDAEGQMEFDFIIRQQEKQQDNGSV